MHLRLVSAAVPQNTNIHAWHIINTIPTIHDPNLKHDGPRVYDAVKVNLFLSEKYVEART